MRKYKFDETFFDKIDSEEKAYWLGFIYADGNVYKSTLSIKLHTKDLDQLEKFKKSIKSEHHISKIKNKEAYRIRIGSIKLINQLSKLGVMPNKNRTIKYPDIEKIFDRHFIRGFFDGDGWITKYKPKTCINFRYDLGFSSNSKDFLDTIKNKIEVNGNLVIKNKNSNRNISYQLTYNSNYKCEKVSDYLYDSSFIYLTRKYNLYKQFKNRKINKSLYIRERDKKGKFKSRLKNNLGHIESKK